MKKKLIILSSVILLSISVSTGYVMRPISDNADGCFITIEQENKLEVEDWMVNSNFWSFDYDLSNDSKLEIEDWMIDENVWN